MVSTRKECFVCRTPIASSDPSKQFERNGRVIVVHEECLGLLGELVRASLQEQGAPVLPVDSSAMSALPAVSKATTSEIDAIAAALDWAAGHHPLRGLTAKEVDKLFDDHYRWKLSNPSARLGELVEKGLASRQREEKEFRYFAPQKKAG
jgi:hypothetical protein